MSKEVLRLSLQDLAMVCMEGVANVAAGNSDASNRY